MTSDKVSKALEDEATELLRQDAKENGTTLFREGILDERRQWMIKKREIPFSSLERKS